MGFRYRKSINLSGGFRINLSKSGVGYSWGVKGYRVTKTAKGTTQRTASIPGTGISYVTETSGKPASAPPQPQAHTTLPEEPDTKVFSNADVYTMSSGNADEILARARRSILFRRLTTWGIIVSLVLTCAAAPCFLLLLLSVLLKLIVKKRGVIHLEYEIGQEESQAVEARMAPIRHLLQCSNVWQVTQSTRNRDTKYSAGAASSVSRVPCKVSSTPPFPFRSNVPVVSIKMKKETLIFLPDQLFVLQSSKVGAISYEDIQATHSTTKFVESGTVPADTEIVGSTWKYVNKSGGPDKRFKDNKELPLCLYGELTLQSASGLNTNILYSNPHRNG